MEVIQHENRVLELHWTILMISLNNSNVFQIFFVSCTRRETSKLYKDCSMNSVSLKKTHSVNGCKLRGIFILCICNWYIWLLNHMTPYDIQNHTMAIQTVLRCIHLYKEWTMSSRIVSLNLPSDRSSPFYVSAISLNLNFQF